MKSVFMVAEMLCAISTCWAQSGKAPEQLEAEYYVTAYAQHYGVPIALARTIVVRESNWQPCAISPKGSGANAVDACHCQAAECDRPLQS